ncbi:MAG: PAS domain S-box protein, partial [Methanomicrobiales archaeon]|nr:PAS domain S-box protein [Methanomicrobiales archaeon]
MMAAGKKKTDGRYTDNPCSTRSLRDEAEEHLASSPKSSPDLKGQTPEELIHELQIHQVELETQAEELKKSRLALGESRDQYLDLYEFAPLGYLTLTDKALIAEVNLTGATLLGVERGKLLMTPFRKCVVENNSDRWYQYFMQILKLEGKQVCTLMLKGGNGSMFPARLEGVRLTGCGDVITVRVAIIDITDIRQSEDALRNSEEKYRTLVETTGTGFVILDEQGRVLDANLEYVKLTGHTRLAEIAGRGVIEWTAAYEKEKNAAAVSQCIRDGYVRNFEIDYVNASGTVIPVEINATALRSRDSVQVLTLCRDITERRRTEEAVRESEKRYHTIYHQSPIAIEIYDTIGTLVHVNPACLKLFGIEDILAIKKFSLFDDPNINDEQKEKLHKGETVQYRGPFDFGKVKKSGLYPTSREGIIWLDVLITPLGNRADSVTGFLVQVQDISERKLAEDSLQRVNLKLNVLSQLTRTELTSQIFLLDGYVEMAQSYAAGQDRIIETLQKGEKAIRSLRGTIAYSKDYQDMGVTPPGWQNVKRTMLFGLSHLPISEIQHSIETGDLEVFSDPLLENAYQRLFEYSLAHGDIVIRVRVWLSVSPDVVNLVFEYYGVGIP